MGVRTGVLHDDLFSVYVVSVCLSYGVQYVYASGIWEARQGGFIWTAAGVCHSNHDIHFLDDYVLSLWKTNLVAPQYFTESRVGRFLKVFISWMSR